MEKRVLIVEDDALLSIVQKRMVEHLGYKVIASARSGEDALKIVKEHTPDIILMDIFLDDGMDGVETMIEIRKYSSVPVIYLSGSSDLLDSERVKQVKPIGFLKKPVKRHEMDFILQKAFQHPGRSSLQN